LAELRGIDPTDDRARRALARDLDGFSSAFARLHPQPPSTEAQTRSMVQAVLAFLDPSALVAAHASYGQGNWFAEVERSVVLHLLASAEQAQDWPAALAAYEGANALPLMTLHKSKGLEYHTVIFVGLDDDAWWSYTQDPVDATAGFFVAFTRAKQRVIFTYSPERGQRTKVAPLYELLYEAGVPRIAMA